MRSSWTKCHKRDSSCSSYPDHARRRIQASRNIHPGYNLIPIVFKLARTSYFQTTWWLQHLPARCAMTRGALEHRQSQMWQKRFQQHFILLAKRRGECIQTVQEVCQRCLACVSCSASMSAKDKYSVSITDQQVDPFIVHGCLAIWK